MPTIRVTVFTACIMLLACALPVQADQWTVLGEQWQGVPPSEMMPRWLLGKVEEADQRWLARYEERTDPGEIREYQQRMRDTFLDQIGGFPERTPLEAQVTERIERDGHVLEKILFQSQPQHYVTAALFLPDAACFPPPYPGVLVPCGHSSNGKAAGAYQRAAIMLAQHGMAALVYDPVDQGERQQMLEMPDGEPYRANTTGHTMMGVGSILLGRNTARFRIWDGIRAIDYLESRSDIDPQRIGCTGNSGGGTLTAYLMALDERIVAAAPACYLTTMAHNLRNIGPQDAEQNLYAQLALGLDHADYVMMRAPRPTLICCATDDYFDIDGTWRTFRHAKRLYTQLGLSYVGLRAEDLLVCARLASSYAGDGGAVELVAVGKVGVPALHAAALHPKLFGGVTMRRALTSWSDLLEQGASHDQLVNAVHGALHVYDLPDLARLLGDRLTITEPVDALGRPLE